MMGRRRKRVRYPWWMISSYGLSGAIAITVGWPQWNGEVSLQNDGFSLLVVGVGFWLVAIVMGLRR